MNENAKTITFVVVAVVLVLVAWISRPSLPEMTVADMEGKTLFEAFDDPLEATSLEILEFDEDTATVRPFKVAQVNNQWSIPSHDNYPADAENQLAEVATSMIGLTVLEMASTSPGDHELFGVVDPDPDKLKAGDTGVGTRVTIRNKKNDVLLNLIIGKEVPDRDGLRYVRVVGKDPVYTVALKTDKLSTRFEDWIEDDLLKLNTWEVKKVRINDYSVDILAGRQTPRSLMSLEYDDSKSEWKLEEARVFENGKYVEVKLAEDEELNTTKLNDMKWALDDLKIVDVARKPEGLSENLRDTGQLSADSEAYQSLMDRGFYIVPVQDHYELLSSEGEVSVLMKDGVQYVLRFGQIAGTGTEESAEEEKEEGEEAGDEKSPEEEESDTEDGGGLNRYLFVMAEFNPEAIPKPELEPLPEVDDAAEGEGATSSDESAGGEGDQAASGNGAENASDTGQNGAEGTTEEASAGAEGDAAGKEESPAAAGEESQPEDADQAATEEAEAAAEETAEETASENEESEASQDTASEDEGKQEDEKSEAEKERERIQKENERKQKEYDDKIKEGKKKVQELNERFANWYYIISDEVYQKIHLSREDVIKKKEKEEEEEGESEEAPESTEEGAADESAADEEGPAAAGEEAAEMSDAAEASQEASNPTAPARAAETAEGDDRTAPADADTDQQPPEAGEGAEGAPEAEETSSDEAAGNSVADSQQPEEAGVD